MNSLSSFFGLSVPSVSVLELNKKLTDGEQLLLLDVREPEEYVSGHIRGSRLIPLGELGNRLNELPKDSQVMCICATGSRSFRGYARIDRVRLPCHQCEEWNDWLANGEFTH